MPFGVPDTVGEIFVVSCVGVNAVPYVFLNADICIKTGELDMHDGFQYRQVGGIVAA